MKIIIIIIIIIIINLLCEVLVNLSQGKYFANFCVCFTNLSSEFHKSKETFIG